MEGTGDSAVGISGGAGPLVGRKFCIFFLLKTIAFEKVCWKFPAATKTLCASVTGP